MNDTITRKEDGEKADDNYRIKVEAALVLDCLDIDIMIISEDYKILYANVAFLEKMKQQKEEVIGRYCYEITHHRNDLCQPPKDPCPIKKVIETDKAAIEIHTHHDHENKEVLVNVTAAPVVLDNNMKAYIHLSLPVNDKDELNSDMEFALRKTEDILKVVSLYQEQLNEIKKRSAELENTKSELEIKITSLEKINKVTIGRELRMVELKKKLKNLEETMDKENI